MLAVLEHVNPRLVVGIRKSLHFLPECIEELRRPLDPAPGMQPEPDPDVALARQESHEHE